MSPPNAGQNSGQNSRLIWIALLVAAVAFLVYRAAFTTPGMSRIYVVDQPVTVSGTLPDGTAQEFSWTVEDEVPLRAFVESQRAIAAGTAAGGAGSPRLSMSRTIGTWFSAFLTLAIFSFLWRDNPLYKLAEAIFIGVSAAYWMVIGFWSVLVPNLIGKLAPATARATVIPGLDEAAEPKFIFLVPLLLGVMLLWRLAPRGQWISRWPLALFIGVFAGLRLVQFFEADFLNQIASGIQPLVAVASEQTISYGESFANIIGVVGTLCCLTYFFFSFEHKGVLGSASRVGIWVLMITFGAMFGYTVMGRIVLLVARIEFLLNDWLWMIDPASNRVVS